MPSQNEIDAAAKAGRGAIKWADDGEVRDIVEAALTAAEKVRLQERFNRTTDKVLKAVEGAIGEGSSDE